MPAEQIPKCIMNQAHSAKPGFERSVLVEQSRTDQELTRYEQAHGNFP